MKKTFYLLSFIFLFSASLHAQSFDRDVLAQKVGRHVDSMGKMEGLFLRDIVNKLYRRDFGEVEITYAIYSWIAKNIVFNASEYHHPRTANTTTSMTLMRRSSTGQGYAYLFKDMCIYARLECYVVEGKAKSNPSAINNKNRLMKHYWNVVKLNGVNYYVDPTFGSGTFDRKFKTFYKEYTDVWCFADKRLFATSHIPSDKKSPFMEGPVNNTRFMQAPIVYSTALKSGIYFPEKTRGVIRGRKDDCKRMIFDVNKPEEINRASVIADGKEEKTDYYVEGNKLYIDVPLPYSGNYPLIISINGKQTFGFEIEAKTAKKKRR